MDIDPELISYLLTIILGILATFFGDKWVKGKNISLKFAVAIRELTKAIEDDRITQEEAVRIVESWSDVIEEANGLYQPKTKNLNMKPEDRIETVEKKVDLILERMN